jgi:hypothetical protein
MNEIEDRDDEDDRDDAQIVLADMLPDSASSVLLVLFLLFG